MTTETKRPGRLRRAPENFLDQRLAREIDEKGLDEKRRRFLRQSFLMASAASAGSSASMSFANEIGAEGREDSAVGDPNILLLPPHSTTLGKPVTQAGYGQPSRHENAILKRLSPGLTRTQEASASFTPLQALFGIITPNGLHFERHHQGWHDVAPDTHRLMIHGLVKTPMIFTMDDLMRLPSVSRIHFLECGANTAMEWGHPSVPTVQYTHGMLSCCEFTGVPLSLLLDYCGYEKQQSRFILAEGADGASLTRTIPIEHALDDVLVAWGMNGEMLRPENGYPLRLVVPGMQGVSWVKWLRRIKVGDQPWGTKDESIQYIDLMPDGSHRQYSSIQECKSVITSPSGGQQLLSKGLFNITGLAWSGRGKIRKVDVSVDGGRNWRSARLEGPIQNKALTRFNIDWVWDGSEAILQSRAVDETGHIQPGIEQLRKVRGSRSTYHNNAIQSWQIMANGEVMNVQVY